MVRNPLENKGLKKAPGPICLSSSTINTSLFNTPWQRDGFPLVAFFQVLLRELASGAVARLLLLDTLLRGGLNPPFILPSRPLKVLL